MTQRTGGVWKIFSSPRMYQCGQNLLGKRMRKHFVAQYLRAKPGDFLLDIGCGTGEVVRYLPDEVQYVGIDASPEYIHFAQQRKHTRARFICGDVTEVDYAGYGRPDLVLAEGLLHHLRDDEICDLLQSIIGIMKTSGRLITIDPCSTRDQHIVARALIRLDRGQNVRSPDGYSSLAGRYFATIRSEVRDDLLSVPYSHCILECTNAPDGIGPGA